MSEEIQKDFKNFLKRTHDDHDMHFGVLFAFIEFLILQGQRNQAIVYAVNALSTPMGNSVCCRNGLERFFIKTVTQRLYFANTSMNVANTINVVSCKNCFCTKSTFFLFFFVFSFRICMLYLQNIFTI